MRKLVQMPPTSWIGLAGVALVWMSVQVGWWWVTFLVGLALGVALPRARQALLVAIIVGALGWGLPLALLAISAPVGGVAGVVAALVGLPAAVGAITVIVGTLVVGCILSVAGAWIGLTGRRLLLTGEMEMRVRAHSASARTRPTPPGTG